MNKLAVEFCGINFVNPVVAASTDISRTSEQFEKLVRSGVGGIITKSVTDEIMLQAKNIARFDIRDMKQNKVEGKIPSEYLFFSRGGSMVSMEEFSNYAPHQLQLAKENQVILIGSISASKKENWVSYAVAMGKMGFPMLELNFGNPHGEASNGKLGFLIGQIPELCCDIAKSIMEKVNIPVVVKLTPQISDMVELTKALKEIGVKAVTIMHRYQGLLVDIETETVALGGWGAIGGTWMKPISLANISKVHRQVDIEICGGNGVDTGKDVMEYIMCGAGIVQIGSTLMLKGTETVKIILKDLEALTNKKEVTSINALKGRLAEKIITYKNLSSLPVIRSIFDKEKCKECEDKPCVNRCYFGALHLVENQLVKDETNCTGCSMCKHICPKQVVDMEEE